MKETKEKMDSILENIADQLKGEIYDELSPKNKYYQLKVIHGVFTKKVQTLDYSVPNPKAALIIIDIICREMNLAKERSIESYKQVSEILFEQFTNKEEIDKLFINLANQSCDSYYFALQYRDNIDDEWEDWEDDCGNSITDYEIDENFNIYLPSELEE